MHLLKILTCCVLVFSFLSCGDDSKKEESQDDFDREGMLVFWADEIIIPAFEQYEMSTEKLVQAKDQFVTQPDLMSLTRLRNAYTDALTSWQAVSMFDIGMAESISLRRYTNIFPTNVELIRSNVASANYNLELPSNMAAQGYPAIDYLLYGTGADEDAIISKLSEPNYNSYLHAITERVDNLADLVLQDWKNGYRDSFIAARGSSATSSVDKMVNDYIFYFEKFLRAGKVGIPAGVFSGKEIESAVESRFEAVNNRAYLLSALKSVRNFFRGVSSIDPSIEGSSLMAYTNYITEKNGTPSISNRVILQLDQAEAKIQELNPSLSLQVKEDNTKMLEAYDELQKLVILFKVEMLQTLNIQVDFVDADGD